MRFKLLLTIFGVVASTAMAQVDETVTIDGPCGKLVADIHKPALQPGEKANLVIQMHGFGGARRGGLMDVIYDACCQSELGALRFDFDGSGESDGRFVDMTVPKEVDDAIAVYEYARTLPWVDKIFFVGHSQGGVVASMAAGKLGDEKVDGLVLLAPAAVLRDDAIRGNTFGIHYNSINPPDSVILHGNLAIGREYILTARDLPIYDTSAGYQGPVMVIHGTGDVVVPYTYGLRYNDIYRNCTVNLMYAADHGFRHHEQEVADLIKTYFTLTVFSYRQ